MSNSLTIIYNCAVEPLSIGRRFLVESLCDHPPTHLNLHITQWYLVDDPSICGMIPPGTAATLMHLTLCVKYQYDGISLHATLPAPPETRWDDLWRHKLLPVLEPLHALTHFRLVFHCHAREAEEPARPIAEEPFVGDLRPIFRSGRFDFTTFASAIADALPSLQYCFVTNSAWAYETKLICTINIVEWWCESRVWRVAYTPTAGGDIHHLGPAGVAAAVSMVNGLRRELVQLEDDVAEAMIQREDLILSMEEKASGVEHLFVWVCANVVLMDVQSQMQWQDL